MTPNHLYDYSETSQIVCNTPVEASANDGDNQEDTVINNLELNKTETQSCNNDTRIDTSQVIVQNLKDEKLDNKSLNDQGRIFDFANDLNENLRES